MEELLTSKWRGYKRLDGTWGHIPYGRYAMQQQLGRELFPNEIVHHKDGNPCNNTLSNLELLFDRAEHASLHHKGRTDLRKVPPSNDLAWCTGRRKFLPKEMFNKNKNKWNGLSFYCKECKKITR